MSRVARKPVFGVSNLFRHKPAVQPQKMIRDLIFEPQHEKTNNVDSDQVLHKPSCAATGDG